MQKRTPWIEFILCGMSVSKNVWGKNGIFQSSDLLSLLDLNLQQLQPHFHKHHHPEHH